MAARQNEIAHQLNDGFVVAWDSSEIDEEVSKALKKVVAEEIDGIVVAITGGPDSVHEVTLPEHPQPRRRRRAAA